MRTVKYRRATVKIMDAPPLKGICDCCGQRRKTDTAHYVYPYPTKMVRWNPRLALDKTGELCFPCHHLLDQMGAVEKAYPETKAKLVLLRTEKLGP